MKLSKITPLALGAIAQGVSATTLKDPEPPYGRNPNSEPAILPSIDEINAARATARSSSPTSNVKGHGFDRIVQIWLENQDFEKCEQDPNMQWLASQGLLLTNYYAVTHPSQPNYAASVSGDTFGMDHDHFQSFPENISTVVDLLDTRHITWGEYQEHLPYAGYRGMNFSNRRTRAPDYVRKHNPLVMFDSVANNETRVSNIKNFTQFYTDLERKTLPQWMFITPNMTNDAHDTNITFAASWLRTFLTPLLSNPYFTDNALILITFDESETYSTANRIYTLLLGPSLPSSLHNTTDPTYYTLYSPLSTVSLNWDLPSLGRWDCSANVLPPVSHLTSYHNTDFPHSTGSKPHLNKSYPGPASLRRHTPNWYPSPNTLAKCASGRGVLDKVKQTWGDSNPGSYNYTSVYPLHSAFDGQGNPVTMDGGGPLLEPVDGWKDVGFSYSRGDDQGGEDGGATGRKGKGKADVVNDNGGVLSRPGLGEWARFVPVVTYLVWFL